VDKDLNIVGDLAERWETSKDGLNITFYLRKDVTWHDGEKFTAEDVLFTFETVRKPETGSPYISNFSNITKIRMINPHIIKFTYEEPYAPALLKFGMGIIPKHLFENIKDIRKSRFARSPVGTGSYKFNKWEMGQYVILEANNDYYKHVPGIKRYVYKVVPDQAVQFLELVNGGLDSMDLNPYQYLYRSNTSEFTRVLQKYKYLAHSYTYIGYNLTDPILKDVRVRKALSYAINKQKIINSALFGLGEESTGPFLSGTPYYDGGVAGYEYNPKKALKLLKKSGWVDEDNDGVLEKDGQKFIITLSTNQGNQAREDAATIIQSQWAEIGVKANIQVVAWSAFMDQFISKKNFQTIILGWTIPIDPDIYSVWHSDSMREGGLNFISYSNSLIDELIEKGRSEFDQVKRADIYKQIHKILAKEVPYTFLYFPYALPAVNKRFQGIDPAPAGIGYNFIDWYVPEDEIKYKF